jgi:hypothetical protein
MTFDEILVQVINLRQRQGRVSYWALKRRFDLDDDYLEDVKEELIYVKQVAVDEEGSVLVWVGDASPTPESPPTYPAKGYRLNLSSGEDTLWQAMA